jgi:nucleoside 2-deoxyribosyltransferase
VYVASALGFSEATRPYSETLLAAVRGAGFEALDPWADPDDATAAALAAADAIADRNERVAALRAVNARLAAGNLAAIRRADAVLGLLDGADVDSGVAAEIGYAAALGKPVVGFRLDFRTAGDNEGGIVNLQVEHLLWAPVARSAEEALDALTVALRDRK